MNTRIGIPDNNVVVNGKGSDKTLMARVYDLATEQWLVVERVDAREMITVGSAAWEEPPAE